MTLFPLGLEQNLHPIPLDPAARPLGFGYDGVFGLVKEGYTLFSAAKA